jgi:hypothetical protein
MVFQRLLNSSKKSYLLSFHDEALDGHGSQDNDYSPDPALMELMIESILQKMQHAIRRSRTARLE